MKKVENGIEIEMSEKEAEELQAYWDRNEEKKRKTAWLTGRLAEYPSIAEQFDLLYHSGYDGWRKTIEAIKLKYPKPTE